MKRLKVDHSQLLKMVSHFKLWDNETYKGFYGVKANALKVPLWSSIEHAYKLGQSVTCSSL